MALRTTAARPALPDLAAIRQWGAGQWSAVAGVVGAGAAVLALFTGGGGGDGGGQGALPTMSGTEREEQPEAVAKRALRNFFRGDWEAYYADLAPMEKKLVPEARFVECESRTKTARLVGPSPIKLKGVEGVRLMRPGVAPRPMTAVTFAVTVEVGAGQKTIDIPRGLVKDDGRWGVVLEDSQWAAYRAGQCPEAETVAPPPRDYGDR